MRRGLLTVGPVALVIGLLVSFVPIFPVPSGSQTIGGGNGTNIAFFQVRSLLIPQYIQIPWSAPRSLTIWAVDCGSTPPVGGSATLCPSNRTLAQESGTSGTLSFSAQAGDWVATGTSGPNASISVRTTNGQVGVVVVGLGAALVLAGLLLREPSRNARDGTPPRTGQSSSARGGGDGPREASGPAERRPLGEGSHEETPPGPPDHTVRPEPSPASPDPVGPGTS